MKNIISLVLLMVISNVCFAGPISYQCTFMEEYELQDNGILQLNKNAQIIGHNFSIDRINGQAITPAEAIWPHANSKATVLATGNADNSFIATYESKALNSGVFLASIRIEEYVASNDKPFVVLANYFVYTGVCK